MVSPMGCARIHLLISTQLQDASADPQPNAHVHTGTNGHTRITPIIFKSRHSLPLSPHPSVPPDNTASIISRRRGFQKAEQELYLLPVVVWDGGEPMLSSTTTLNLRVCVCLRGTRGHNLCQAQAFLSTAGLSTGAFIAILLCILILLG